MKHYCPLPFINIYSELDGFDPCCNWNRIKDNNVEENFNQAFNGKKIIQIRNDLLNGKEIANCQYCYNDENSGQTSFREQAIQTWGVVTTAQLKRLDIVFDNICNLKCRGCNSSASHLWYEDEIKLYGTTFVKQKYTKSTSYQNIDARHLEQISISGGEPFYSNDCEKFLEHLRKNNYLKNIGLTFATNSTIVPNHSFQQSLLECKSLTIVLSIDGYKEMNEYFRSPSKWDQCVKAMDYFNSLIDQRKGKETNILFRSTVYIYNVNKLKEIDNFFEQHFPRFIISKRNLSIEPAFLSIKNMPENYKKIIRPIIESYGAEYSDVLSLLNEEGEDLFDSFVSFHTQLDQIRNESLGTINPILSNYIKDYRVLNTEIKKLTIEEMKGNCVLSETISNG
jgi:MoaA/NifB/PqqE/SkfB family radical SAM enzyme